jgi:hypothetical protein
MDNQIAQINTFIGYETMLQDAIESAQKAANIWLAQHRLGPDQVAISAQTIAETVPSQDQVFYIHIITVAYGRQAG